MRLAKWVWVISFALNSALFVVDAVGRNVPGLLFHGALISFLLWMLPRYSHHKPPA